MCKNKEEFFVNFRKQAVFSWKTIDSQGIMCYNSVTLRDDAGLEK